MSGTSQLRLILTLRGLTPAFNSFNDAQFDEAHFEADPRLEVPSCWYWSPTCSASLSSAAISPRSRVRFSGGRLDFN